MRTFSIIVAVDLKNGIGKNGKLPWHLTEDLKRFKEITCATSAPEKKNVVIMGRKTWESIPENYRPLTDRFNLVLSKNQDIILPEGVLKAQSFDEAFKTIERDEFKDLISDVFVIGGQKVFEESIKYNECRKLYVTHVFGDYDCDTFFPQFSHEFIPSVVSSFHHENSIKYRFVVYQRF